MPGSKSSAELFFLPEDWTVIGSGKNKYHGGVENDYFVIDSGIDIFTVLVYSTEMDFRHMTELASWKFVRRVKIGEHDGFIHMHPEGFRKMLAWFCPGSDRTILVHFSKMQDEVVQAFRKTKCHNIGQ